MGTYAKDTEVPTDRSRSEIERTLQRYGATAFMYGWAGEKAIIGFKIRERQYKMVLPLPEQEQFCRTPSRGTLRSQKETLKAWEQGTRQRWRALALWIKAVLEASEAGIVTLETALQPFVMLPNGKTVGDWMAPQIEQAYLTGKMPSLLPMLEEPKEREEKE